MPRPIVVLPDAELTLIQYLRARTEVTSKIPAARIVTSIPPKPTYPIVLVSRAGGKAVVKEYIDEPALQVSVVGGTKYDCSELIRTIRAAIVSIANDRVDAGLLVSGFEEVGAQWTPDTTTTPPLSRYIARFTVLMHP
jgi:hypothetical protein